MIPRLSLAVTSFNRTYVFTNAVSPGTMAPVVASAARRQACREYSPHDKMTSPFILKELWVPEFLALNITNSSARRRRCPV